MCGEIENQGEHLGFIDVSSSLLFFLVLFLFSNIVIGLMFVCILTCQGYIGKEKQLEKNPTDRRLAAVVCLICALVS